MRRACLLLVLVLLSGALAGCVGGPSDTHGTEGVPLPPPGTYLFDHPGGPLRFTHTGGENASWELYGPDEARLGLFRVDAAHPEVEPELEPGPWALRVLEAANVTVTATAPELAVDDLLLVLEAREHVERHVLVDRPAEDLPPGTLFGIPVEPNPVHEQQAVELTRAPQSLRVLASGSFDGLQVMVRTPLGPVLEVQDAQREALVGPFMPIADVDSAFYGTNVSGRTLDVQVDAAHVDGALILEAWSFSRAPAPRPAPPAEAALFLYGDVSGRPSWFQVHPRADHLVAAAEEDAVLTVWGPSLERVATVEVPAGAPVRVPVEGGMHVAMAWGTVTLGAARAPADLELHPVEVRVEQRGGFEGGDTYTRHEIEIGGEGVLYEVLVHPYDTSFFRPDFGLTCEPALVRVLQDTEVVATTANGGQETAGPRLVDGPATVTVEGTGPCLAGGFQARSFILPGP